MPEKRKIEDIITKEWLLDPIASNEVKMFIEVGDDAPVTPEFRSALEDFINELKSPAGSPEMRCQPEHNDPCSTFSTCRIT
jgi:hypothetical protein